MARRSCQTALYHIAEALVRWMAPILSFTADEVWGYLPGDRAQFVFTEEWYRGLFGLDAAEQMNDAFWAELLKVRGEVNRVIEQARNDKKVGDRWRLPSRCMRMRRWRRSWTVCRTSCALC